MNNSSIKKAISALKILSYILIFSIAYTPGICDSRFLSFSEAGQKALIKTGIFENTKPTTSDLESLKEIGSAYLSELNSFNSIANYSSWLAGGLFLELERDFSLKLEQDFPEFLISSSDSNLQRIPSILASPTENTEPQKILWNHELSGSFLLQNLYDLKGQGTRIGVVAFKNTLDHVCLKKTLLTVKEFSSVATESTEVVSLVSKRSDLYLTHPLGILAGSESKSFTGIAPLASITLALIDKDSDKNISLMKSLEWILSPEHGSAPTAIVFMLDFNGTCPIAFQRALAAIRNVGILPIVPAGNNPSRIRGMAALPYVVTIGAIDRWKSRAYFSGIGPAIFENQKILKPDFMEPGLAVLGPTMVDEYRYGSGTIQAAVHFAGVITLLKQRYPEMHIELILNAIKATSLDIGQMGPDYENGFGLPSISAAINRIDNPPPAQNY